MGRMIRMGFKWSDMGPLQLVEGGSTLWNHGPKFLAENIEGGRKIVGVLKLDTCGYIYLGNEKPALFRVYRGLYYPVMSEIYSQ